MRVRVAASLLISLGVGIVISCRRESSLLLAAAAGDITAVKTCVERGAALNDSDSKGNTPLMLAAAHGHGDVVQVLLRHHASVDGHNNEGQTALLAALGPHGSNECVAAIVAAGADVNVPDRFGNTPLMEAASWNSVDSLRLLLSKGADANAGDLKGRTALMCIGNAGTPLATRSVTLLVQGGADVNAKSKEGLSPLAWARSINCTPCVDILVRSAARPHETGQKPSR